MRASANKRVLLGAAILLTLAACQSRGDSAAVGPAVVPPVAGDRATVSESSMTPENSRPLGLFETEAQAVAAARAAGLGPGIYGLASAGGRPLAITADGTVYLRQQGSFPIVPSRPAQRPPQ